MTINTSVRQSQNHNMNVRRSIDNAYNRDTIERKFGTKNADKGRLTAIGGSISKIAGKKVVRRICETES